MNVAPGKPSSPSSDPDPQPTTESNPKVTTRMLKIRELIELGEYPDRDELAEHIVDTSTPQRVRQ